MDLKKLKDGFKASYGIELDESLVYAFVKHLVERRKDRYKYNVHNNYFLAEFRTPEMLEEYIRIYEGGNHGSNVSNESAQGTGQSLLGGDASDTSKPASNKSNKRLAKKD